MDISDRAWDKTQGSKETVHWKAIGITEQQCQKHLEREAWSYSVDGRTCAEPVANLWETTLGASTRARMEERTLVTIPACFGKCSPEMASENEYTNADAQDHKHLRIQGWC